MTANNCSLRGCEYLKQNVMEKLKQEIINILISEQGKCKTVDFELVSDKILNLIQIIFDPENQPNQLGIENPFDFKYLNRITKL